MFGFQPYAIIVTLVFGGSVLGAYWYGGSVREAKIYASQAKVLEEARTKANQQKEDALVPIVQERDKALANLAKIRAEKRALLEITPEVHSENTSCTEPRIGSGFVELHNAASETFNAMHEAR